MLWIYRLFFGYIRISFCGNYAERMLNLCAANGVSVWGIKSKKGKIFLNCFAKDFKKIARLRGKNGTKVHIISKKGFPFLINRYKSRVSIALGMLAFTLIINLLSGYVWNINVVGNKKVSSAEILESCKKTGVYEGVKANSIDPYNARVELLLMQKNLSWASINVEGTVVTVNVRETAKKKKEDTPCNIVAGDDGIITHIDVTKGDVCVKVGDTVSKGQMLVNGAVMTENGGTQFVHSKGRILAAVPKTFSSVVGYRHKEKQDTGRAKTCRVLSFFGVKIPLYIGGAYKNCRVVVKHSKITVNKRYLPIYVDTAVFVKQKTTVGYYTKQKAKQIARDMVEKEIEKTKSDSVQVIKSGFCLNDDSVSYTKEYVCTKNIAEEKEIIISTFN